MPISWRASLAAVALAAAAAVPSVADATSTTSAGHYDHIFVVVEENHGFSEMIGNSAAPNLISQLDAKKLPWKAYLQGLPHAGYQAYKYCDA